MKPFSKIICSSLVLAVSLALPTSVFAEATIPGEKARAALQEAAQAENNETPKTAEAKEVPEIPKAETAATIEETIPESNAPVTTSKKEPEKEATPLATAKTNVKVEINTGVNPAIFATAAMGVQLTFKTNPDVSSLGSKSVIIMANDGTKTEEITINYTVQDTQKPEITLIDKVNIVGLDEDWYADEFVDVSDNSDDYDIFFANGQEKLDTSKVGKFSTEIIARDRSGNESRITLNYEVIEDQGFLEWEFNYAAPTIDKAKSTATDIYGKTRPNTLVGVIDPNSESLLAHTLADDNGNFHITLKKGALKKGQLVYIQSIDLENAEISGVAEYTYNGQNLPIQPTTNKLTSAPLKKADPKNTIKQVQPLPAKLPKAGDSSQPVGAVGIGLLATLIAAFYLKKRN